MKRYSMQIIPGHKSRGEQINPVENSDGRWVMAEDVEALASQVNYVEGLNAVVVEQNTALTTRLQEAERLLEEIHSRYPTSLLAVNGKIAAFLAAK